MKNYFNTWPAMAALALLTAVSTQQADAYTVKEGIVYDITADDLINPEEGLLYEQDNLGYVVGNGKDKKNNQLYMHLNFPGSLNSNNLKIEKVDDTHVKVCGMFGGRLNVTFRIVNDVKIGSYLIIDKTGEIELYKPCYVAEPTEGSGITKAFIFPLAYYSQGLYEYYNVGSEKEAMKSKPIYVETPEDIDSENFMFDEDRGNNPTSLVIEFENKYHKGIEVHYQKGSDNDNTITVDILKLKFFKNRENKWADFKDEHKAENAADFTERRFEGEFIYKNDNKIQFTSLGKQHFATNSKLQFSADINLGYGMLVGTPSYYEGGFDLASGTAYIDCSNVYSCKESALVAKQYATLMSSVRLPIYHKISKRDGDNASLIEQLTGTVELHPEYVVHDKGTKNHNWVDYEGDTNGSCITKTRLHFKFPDAWGSYTNAEMWGAKPGFAEGWDEKIGTVRNIEIIPRRLFDCTHHVQFEDVHISHRPLQQIDENNRQYLEISGNIHEKANPQFVMGHKIYVIQGKVSNIEDVDLENKAELIDCEMEATNINGMYSFCGKFYPTEEYLQEIEKATNGDLTFFIETIYSQPQQKAKRASSLSPSSALEPTYHHLYTQNFGIMTGVDMNTVENLAINAVKDGVLVTGDKDVEVNIYDASGRKVATGRTNTTIALDNGLYIVKAAGKVAKIAR